MTMIAFANYGDHVELMTDTMSYTPGGREIAYCTKHVTLNHIDAVMATQGDARFAMMTQAYLSADSRTVRTFDDLIATATEELRSLWVDSESPSGIEASTYLLGYSEEVGAFRAYRFLQEHDFATEEIPQGHLHVTPSPLTIRPQEFELDRYDDQYDEPMPAEFRESWLARPEQAPPADLEEWGMLALRVRLERSVPQHPMKHFIGGKVIYTRMEIGALQTLTLLEFDGEGEEFVQMMAGTKHPTAQHGPCTCGSGKTLLECCAADNLDEPCGCRRPGAEGKSFRECCMVPAPA